MRIRFELPTLISSFPSRLSPPEVPARRLSTATVDTFDRLVRATGQSNGSDILVRCSQFFPVIPLLVPLVAISVTIITYVLSVRNGHVKPFFPYVSDTAGFGVEAIFFTQGFNILATLGLIFAVIRYQNASMTISKAKNLKSTDKSLANQLNSLVLKLSLIMSFVISLCANFRTTEPFYFVHIVAGMSLFGLMPLITVLLTRLSFLMLSESVSWRLAYWRLGIASLTLTACLTSSIAGIFSGVLSKDFGYNVRERMHLTTADPGFPFHVVSTTSEWIGIYSVAIFIGTYYVEFEKTFNQLKLANKIR